MLKINDSIARIPMEEFAKLDPWYWDSNANKYYETENCSSYVSEASKRNERRRNEMKHGDIYTCEFRIPIHSRRPGIVLIINGIKPVVCPICTSDHRSDYKNFSGNIDLVNPSMIYPHKMNKSHVATNRFRYVKDPKMQLLEKIGHADTENLKEIVELFLRENADPKQMDANNFANIYESVIDFQSLDDTMEDLKDF